MGVIAIVGGSVVDGTGAPPVSGATVLIEGAQIAAVGQGIEVPSDAQRIDAEGRFILPGLIDGHMHVTSMPAFLDAMGHLRANLRAVGKLADCLSWGTTTVANVGGCPENVLLRQAIKEGYIGGCARMLVGAMVNATGGHVRGRAADGPWEVRKAVREMISSGADFVKTAASGGFQWEHERIEWEDYTVEELDALVQETHSKDKRVAVHAHAQPGLQHAIETGCDIITHGALIDEEALEGIAEHDLFFMPTLYITSERSYSREALPSHMKERMMAAYPVHRAGVSKAHEMGITLCAGTDGGPGDVNYELIELVHCGLSAMDAIVAATRNTADALGILDRVGTLEPDKWADLILVDGDPLSDIAVLYDQGNIPLVMKNGKVEIADAPYKHHLHPRNRQ
jgi:imidazolonepropionase-like amidohydrolase